MEGESPSRWNVIKHPVTALDLLPTAISAAGGEIEKNWKLDGVNLLPYLSGDKKGRPHQTIYWRMNEMWSIRDGDWKVVKDRGNRTPKLFDLSKDPNEKKDLAVSEIETVKQLTAKFNQWASTVERPRFGWWKGIGLREVTSDGLANEKTDINAKDTSQQDEKKLPDLKKPIINTRSQKT